MDDVREATLEYESPLRAVIQMIGDENVVTVDEPFHYVISELGREGVSWLRLHASGVELWVNLANVTTINEEIRRA